MRKGKTFAQAALLAVLASPLNLLLLRLEILPGPISLMLVVALDVVATLALGRLLGSRCAAALIVAVLDLPLLFSLGLAESGPWASVLALPKYTVQAVMAWTGWTQPTAGRARWPSIAVATMGALIAAGSWVLGR